MLETYSSRFVNASPQGSGYRLIGVILYESLLVALVGGVFWGMAWELDHPFAGLVAAIAIWLTVSPIIEVITVLRYRRGWRPLQDNSL